MQDVQVRSDRKGPLVLKLTATPHGVPSTKALTSGPVPGKAAEIHPMSIGSGTSLATEIGNPWPASVFVWGSLQDGPIT